MAVEIERIPEFDKDIKQLLKRFRTLEGDLETFVRVTVNGYHMLGQQVGGIVRITGLGFDKPAIFKARKFACRALKGRGADSGIRIIYSYDEERRKITLAEIYFKGDKENEDRKRIQQRFGS